MMVMRSKILEPQFGIMLWNIAVRFVSQISEKVRIVHRGSTRNGDGGVRVVTG